MKHLVLFSSVVNFSPKYTAYMDNSSLFFLIAEHSFTWDKIVLLKKVHFGPKIEFKEEEKNIVQLNPIKPSNSPPPKKNVFF